MSDMIEKILSKTAEKLMFKKELKDIIVFRRLKNTSFIVRWELLSIRPNKHYEELFLSFILFN